MKALVTGGTGFLGSHVVERLLEQGHEVRALARKTSDITHLKTTAAEIILGDIEEYDSLRPTANGVDIVINAAATRCAEVEATGADFDEILNIVAGDNSRGVYFEGELDPHPGRGRSQGDRAAPSPDGARRCDRRRHGMAGTADARVETQRKRRLA